jgi:hypothetical protein
VTLVPKYGFAAQPPILLATTESRKLPKRLPWKLLVILCLDYVTELRRQSLLRRFLGLVLAQCIDTKNPAAFCQPQVAEAGVGRVDRVPSGLAEEKQSHLRTDAALRQLRRLCHAAKCRWLWHRSQARCRMIGACVNVNLHLLRPPDPVLTGNIPAVAFATRRNAVGCGPGPAHGASRLCHAAKCRWLWHRGQARCCMIGACVNLL